MFDEAAGKREILRLIFKALGIDEITGLPSPTDHDYAAAFGRALARKLLKNIEGPEDTVRTTIRGGDNDPWSLIVATILLSADWEIIEIHADVTLKPSPKDTVTLKLVQVK